MPLKFAIPTIVFTVNTILILDASSGILVPLTEFLLSGTQSKINWVDLSNILNDVEGYSALNDNSNKIIRDWFCDSTSKNLKTSW